MTNKGYSLLSGIVIVTSLFLTASLPPTRPAFTGGGYRLYAEKSDKSADYRVNDFYSVYYVYMDVIRALDVDDRLGRRHIQKIMSLIIDNLKKGNVVQLRMDNHKRSGTLRVTLRTDIRTEDGKPALWIISNYNIGTKKIVSGDDRNNAFGTFFYIAGGKLVNYHYAHDPKKDSDLKKESVNDRADYYLLDGEPGNDGFGRDLLTREIGKADKPDRALLYMTLSEYELLSGNVAGAKQCLAKARAILGTFRDPKKKASLSTVLRYADDLYAYYVNYEKPL